MPIHALEYESGGDAERRRSGVRRRLLDRFNLGWALAVVSSIVFLLWAKAYSFLFFHSLAELFSIMTASAAFTVAWNSRRHHASPGLTLLGMGLLAVAALEVPHLLAYRGMSVFPNAGAGLSTQLWVASRYVLGTSLIVVPLFLRPRRELVAQEVEGQLSWAHVALAIHAAIVAILLMSILWWGIFPACFSEETGLTPFKRASEYIVCGLLLVSGGLFWLRRHYMERGLIWLALAAIGLAVLSSLCFTMYNDVYSWWSWSGHTLKIASYAMVYQALVVTGLREPMDLMFRDLRDNEVRLLEARDDAERAGAAKDQFLAVLSHELRNPLNPVLAHACDLLCRNDLPDDVLSDLATIRRNVELEARLIDDLLDLTRISKGKLELVRRQVDLNDLVSQALEICKDGIAEKGLTVETELRATRAHAHADAARVLQAFWNVLKNAVKFSRPGGRVEVQTADGDDGMFVLTVRDEGIGIASDELESIFDTFRQGNRLVTRQFGGLGLGLSIGQSLVELHGGAIRAASDGPGRGSTFTIELPADVSLQTAGNGTGLPSDPSAAAEDSGTAGHDEEAAVEPLRLLLVEDHRDTATIMARLLRRMGHCVTISTNLAEARAAADADTFDLVVSDLGLPDGSGNELMRGLRDKHGLRGICLSGFGMVADVDESRESGFERHLVKPVNLDELQSALAELTADGRESTAA